MSRKTLIRILAVWLMIDGGLRFIAFIYAIIMEGNIDLVPFIWSILLYEAGANLFAFKNVGRRLVLIGLFLNLLLTAAAFVAEFFSQPIFDGSIELELFNRTIYTITDPWVALSFFLLVAVISLVLTWFMLHPKTIAIFQSEQAKNTIPASTPLSPSSGGSDSSD